MTGKAINFEMSWTKQNVCIWVLWRRNNKDNYYCRYLSWSQNLLVKCLQVLMWWRRITKLCCCLQTKLKYLPHVMIQRIIDHSGKYKRGLQSTYPTWFGNVKRSRASWTKWMEIFRRPCEVITKIWLQFVCLRRDVI